MYLQWRFAVLCLAALEAALQLDLGGSSYGNDCIFVANDWHASLVPVYLAAKFRPGGALLGSRSVLAIHNLRHQVSRADAAHTFFLFSSPNGRLCRSPPAGGRGGGGHVSWSSRDAETGVKLGM